MLILYSELFSDDSICIFMRYPCLKIMSVFNITLGSLIISFSSVFMSEISVFFLSLLFIPNVSLMIDHSCFGLLLFFVCDFVHVSFWHLLLFYRVFLRSFHINFLVDHCLVHFSFFYTRSPFFTRNYYCIYYSIFPRYYFVLSIYASFWAVVFTLI